MTIQKLESGFLGIQTGKCNAITKTGDFVIKKLSLIQRPKNACLQAFSTRLVWSENHCRFAFKESLEKTAGKSNFSNKLETEFLIRLSGQKQIQTAFEKFGIQNDLTHIGLACFASTKQMCNRLLKKTATEIELTETKSALKQTPGKQKQIMKAFGISQKNLKTISDLPKDERLDRLIRESISLIELEH